LFGAVHLLLSSEPPKGDPLVRYYPGLVEPNAPPTDAFPAFRRFCLAHAGAIAEIIGRRSVNTNEVGRCAVLRIGYAEISRMLVAARFAVVEIGAGAGLNLFWDRYRYEYESAERAPMVAGDLGSSVRIGCAVRGTAAVGPGRSVRDTRRPTDRRRTRPDQSRQSGRCGLAAWIGLA
jgi:hypothetical protein